MNSVCSQLRALTRVMALCVVTAFIYLLWACITPLLLVSEQASYWWRSFNGVLQGGLIDFVGFAEVNGSRRLRIKTGVE